MGIKEDISNARDDIAELKALLDVSKRPKVQSMLTVELRRAETKLVELLEKQEKENQAETVEKKASAEPKVYDVLCKNYSWDQSDKFVKFYISNLKNVRALSPEAIVTNMTSKSVNVKVCNLDGKNHVFEIKELCDEIVPENSSVKVKTDMVVIFLAKAAEGKTWKFVTAAEKAKQEKKDDAFKPKSDAGSSSDPTAGIMDLMKKMYDEGDDEMKRTIAKAWTESKSNKMPGLPDI